MAADFPTSVWTPPTLTDNVTWVNKALLDQYQDEIEAIENVLLGETASNIFLGATSVVEAVLTVTSYEDIQGVVIVGFEDQAAGYFVIKDSAANAIASVTLSPTSGQTSFSLYTTAAAKNAVINFYSESTRLWQAGLGSSGKYFIYNVVEGYDVLATTTKGNTTLSGGTDVGKELLTLKQNDADKAFIDYNGTAAASAAANISTWTSGNSIQGFVKIEVEGTAYWMPYYDAPTS